MRFRPTITIMLALSFLEVGGGLYLHYHNKATDKPNWVEFYNESTNGYCTAADQDRLQYPNCNRRIQKFI